MVDALALAGCVLPPKESAHPQPFSAAQLGLTGAPFEPTAESWWSSFGDPQLDRLIRLGLDNSPTLAQARARVQEALAQVHRPGQDCCQTLTSQRTHSMSELRQTKPDSLRKFRSYGRVTFRFMSPPTLESDMMAGFIGNISDEATTWRGNILVEATRQRA